MARKERLNIYIANREVYQFLVRESDNLGISKSAYINMLLSQKMNGQETMEMMKQMSNNMPQMLELMQKGQIGE